MKNPTINSHNYNYYKLPITINPLDYGKLILKIDELKLFIMQVNKTNVALIYEYDEFNHIKFFNEGDLIFEFKDHKINENTFVRTLDNKQFTFENNKLTTTVINTILNRLNLNRTTLIHKLGIRNFSNNIIKLRRVRSNYN